jgi:hypothetical protein
MAQSHIIYEVNLEVQPDVESAFMDWLNSHVPEMLTMAGFLEATIYRRAAADEGKQTDAALVTVLYTVSDRASLEAYFAEHAPRMRADGLSRFPGALVRSFCGAFLEMTCLDRLLFFVVVCPCSFFGTQNGAMDPGKFTATRRILQSPHAFKK